MRSPEPVRPVPDAIRARRAVREFDGRTLDEGVLAAILEDAHLAPSGYNLQPTKFVLVRGDGRRALARAACDQRQVAEAPVTVVIAADTRPDLAQAEQVLAMDLGAGAIDEEKRRSSARTIALAFQRGPLGLLGPVKGLVGAGLSYSRPTPRIPAYRPREWAIAQSMLAASHLLLSATARGVASCPMQGFDERRVKRLLGIPRRFVVPVIVALGHQRPDQSPPARRTRLPSAEVVFEGYWKENH